MILEVRDINTYYGTSHILFNVSLEIKKGELVCLLGRNGSGKTTTLRSLMGLTPPKSGSVKFHGEELVGKPPYYIAKKGIGYVPDNRLIFPDLTVRENLLLGVKDSQYSLNEKWNIEKIYEVFPYLKKLDKHLGGHLSGGEQQMLTIGASPSTGSSNNIISEQNVRFSMQIADRAYVINKGRIEYSGSIEELSRNEEIKHKYLMI